MAAVHAAGDEVDAAPFDARRAASAAACASASAHCRAREPQAGIRRAQGAPTGPAAGGLTQAVPSYTMEESRVAQAARSATPVET